MADWTAPFHAPHMTSEQFRQTREKYVKKHGYTVTIPGFEDIVHIPVEKPMTPQEERWWHKKNYSNFTPDRMDEIRYIKKRRREKFLAMLGSPQPDIFQARGSLIGAIDDAEDALSTGASIGAVALRFLPEGAKRLIRGPVGWVMTGADILNAMNETITPEHRLMKGKRDIEKVTEKSPKARTGKIRKISDISEKAKEVLRKRLKKGETWTERIEKHGIFVGTLLEAAQVADNVFGVGLSLGAMMNLPLDIAAGDARYEMGQKVNYKLPWPDLGHWERMGMAALKGMAAMNGYEHHTDDDLEIRNYVCSYLQHQVVANRWLDRDPLKTLGSIKGLKVQAPRPKKLLTLEVIREAGDDPDAGIAWPQTGERWSEVNDLMAATAPIATRNLRHFSERMKHRVKGFVGGAVAADMGFYALENIAGRGLVSVDHTASSKAMFGLMTMGLKMPPDVTDKQKSGLVDYLKSLDKIRQAPKVKDICQFASTALGFTFVHHTGT